MLKSLIKPTPKDIPFAKLSLSFLLCQLALQTMHLLRHLVHLLMFWQQVVPRSLVASSLGQLSFRTLFYSPRPCS